MKGFLLAAGNGTRLRPLTNQIPKCLVPIQGTPLLGIWLDWCCLYGIDQVLINTHAHRAAVREYIQNYKGPVHVTLTEEPQLLGSAGTLYLNRHFVTGEPEFAVMYADVLTNCRLDLMLELHRRMASPLTLGTYAVPNPTQCGIVVTDEEGKVIDFTEKPAQPRANTAFSGVMIAGPAVLASLPATQPADIGFDLLPRFVNRMYAMPGQDYVLDIGTIEKYQQAQREWPGLQPASVQLASR